MGLSSRQVSHALFLRSLSQHKQNVGLSLLIAGPAADTTTFRSDNSVADAVEARPMAPW